MIKRRILTTVLVLLILGGGTFFALQNVRSSSQRQERSEGIDPMQEQEAVAVRVAAAEYRRLVTDIVLPGEVQARDTTRAHPDTAGKLSRFALGPGDRVTEDQPIAWIDSSRPGAQFEESPVRAPITGNITVLHVDRGTQVTPNTAIATIATLDDLRIVVAVPEQFSPAVRTGMTAIVSGPALGNQTIDARIVAIDPVFDSVRRSREVTLRILGDARRLSPGMSVGVSLPLRVRDADVVIPFRAIIQEGGRTSVYLAVDDTAKHREIRTGMIAGGRVEITEGLTVGETVITEGINTLRPGVPINVVEEGEL